MQDIQSPVPTPDKRPRRLVCIASPYSTSLIENQYFANSDNEQPVPYTLRRQAGEAIFDMILPKNRYDESDSEGPKAVELI